MRGAGALVARGVVALALAAVAVLCALRGVEVRPSTGGLLVAPVPTTRVLGAWVALAVVLGTAALLVALSVAQRWARRRA